VCQLFGIISYSIVLLRLTCRLLFIVVLVKLLHQCLLQTVLSPILNTPLYTFTLPYHKDNLSFAFICINLFKKSISYRTPS